MSGLLFFIDYDTTGLARRLAAERDTTYDVWTGILRRTVQRESQQRLDAYGYSQGESAEDQWEEDQWESFMVDLADYDRYQEDTHRRYRVSCAAYQWCIDVPDIAEQYMACPLLVAESTFGWWDYCFANWWHATQEFAHPVNEQPEDDVTEEPWDNDAYIFAFDA